MKDIACTRNSIATMLVFALFLLVSPTVTHAFLSNESLAENSVFAAGVLDFGVSTTNLVESVNEGATTTVNFEVSETGSVPAQYRVYTESHSCANGFYNGLNIAIENNSVQVFSGLLASAQATSSDDGTWNFSITTNPDVVAIAGDVCEVDIHIAAWQTEFTTTGVGGFSKDETVRLTLTAASHLGRTVVLNEVLPNPEGDDSQGGLQGEWVELYNTSTSSVDVTNWYIEDEAHNRVTITSATTFNGQTTLNAPGSFSEWAVVFMSGAILNNDGDTVYLYDANDNLRDSYSYGTSVNDADSDSNNTPNGDNSGAGGAETSGQEGKSDARIPDGTDNWVDPVPTPGAPNILNEESAVLLSVSVDSNDQSEPLTMVVTGANPAFVKKGTNYSDLGAKAFNSKDAEMGVTTTGEVDVNTAGEYRIIYSAADGEGNTITGERIVVVYEGELDEVSTTTTPTAPYITYATTSDSEKDSTSNQGGGDSKGEEVIETPTAKDSDEGEEVVDGTTQEDSETEDATEEVEEVEEETGESTQDSDEAEEIAQSEQQEDAGASENTAGSDDEVNEQVAEDTEENEENATEEDGEEDITEADEQEEEIEMEENTEEPAAVTESEDESGSDEVIETSETQEETPQEQVETQV